MASLTASETEDTGLTSLLYDPKARGLLFQVLLLTAVVSFFAWILDNTITNLAAQGKKSGFGFLGETSGFQILTTLGTFVMEARAGVATYLDVFWIGVINTLIISFIGIIAATLMGFLMGIFRLSSNVVLRGFATFYVEILRNIPLLLQIFFWYFVVLRALPDKRASGMSMGFLGEFPMNVTGLYTSYPIFLEGFSSVVWAFLAACVLAWIVSWLAKKRQEATGRQFPSFWVGLLIIAAIPLFVFYQLGGPLEMESARFLNVGDPILDANGEPTGRTASKIKAGYVPGEGGVIKPEFIALWLALSLYTASFIAEIVRAGILAVPGGQTEAAKALGISPSVTLRKVIIPQAMRVIIPPLTSQFLNLTKNSSLAIAIAYPDLVSIFAGTALNQVGQEIEMIFMMMMVYLIISLGTAAFMNWFNARMMLVER